MVERSAIAAAFISVRRDAPKMEGTQAAKIVADMFGVSAFAVACAVGMDAVLSMPAKPMKVTHNGVTVSNL